MVSRVGKFVGGLGVDVTNVANVHATETTVIFLSGHFGSLSGIDLMKNGLFSIFLNF